MPRVSRPRALTALMCAYLGLTVLGFHGVAALLPGFMDLWHLSETEAGWLVMEMVALGTLTETALPLKAEAVPFSGVASVMMWNVAAKLSPPSPSRMMPSM